MKDYKNTLNLPRTDFPMKAGLAEREPKTTAEWQASQTYEKMLFSRQNKEFFVLHDGPPYANGNIHIGHCLNKILKDIVIKYKNMAGFHAEFIPGWDCHGLPIELGVEKKLREQKQDKAALSKVQIRQMCREYAKGWIEKQREQFKRLGILARWDNPYMTMSSSYCASIIRELGRISETGALYRGNKPVYWCPNCATALADAEIEYANHLSHSVYVKFEFESAAEFSKHLSSAESLGAKVANEFLALTKNKPIFAVIWTTTPWTLPANLAIALHPKLEYTVFESDTELYLLASGLVEKFVQEAGITNYKLHFQIKGEALENLVTKHPFMNRASPLILGEHVTLDAGSGLVHTAPGHGMEDYIAGKKYGLEVFAPVDHRGRYTKEVPQYEGMKAFEANTKIVEDLKNSGHLVAAKKLEHSYPHCWRCHGAVMFRATPQWFISMENTGLRQSALAEIQKTKFVPEWGINRIESMVAGRPDWCISRQRTWGVPLPIFYCEKCEEPLKPAAQFEHIAQLMEKHGPDVWYEWDPDKLLLPQSKCSSCENETFRKETDILDVWFDSGVSHAAVLDSEFGKGKVRWPADLYLEGSDQHRGWFQTSLITSVATRKKAPFRTLLTHGFVNDALGKKMSKSKGNVTDPIDFVSKYGAEILRLWVVLEDYRNDVNFSMETIERISDGYRKMRNTFRYILGNLYDFTPKDAVPLASLHELDQWALHKTYNFLKTLEKAYENYEFHLAYHSLINFCTVDLSAVYFDILKDRLYTARHDSAERRSSQTVLYEMLLALTKGLAPILSFTAEEIWKTLPASMNLSGSIFEQAFPLKEWKKNLSSLEEKLEANAARMNVILDMRSLVNKELEPLRAAKTIGHPLEAEVHIEAAADQIKILSSTTESLARLFIVSKVTLQEAADTRIVAKAADGTKCARCWTYTFEVGTNKEHDDLCSRCVNAVS